MVFDRFARRLDGLHRSDCGRTFVCCELHGFQSFGSDSLRCVNAFPGLQDGAPAKLYLPRDYSGAYCDFRAKLEQWTQFKGSGAHFDFSPAAHVGVHVFHD